MRLIDADVLLDSIFKSCNTTEATINNAPTIDAVPVVHGEWKKDGEYPWLLNCSGCGYSTECGTNYCPNCGAKMEDKPCG